MKIDPRYSIRLATVTSCKINLEKSTRHMISEAASIHSFINLTTVIGFGLSAIFYPVI